MAAPGIDYKLVRIPSPKTRARLEEELVRCDFHHEHGLSYQKCRFCDRGLGDVPYLLKYAVRHYVCEDCKRYYAQEFWKRRT